MGIFGPQEPFHSSRNLVLRAARFIASTPTRLEGTFLVLTPG